MALYVNYNYFIFDMDGTLADTSPGVFAGVRLTLREMGEPPVPENELHRFIGPPLHQSFHDICGMDEKKAMEATLRFRSFYKVKGVFQSNLYSGMETLLRTLKADGHKLMVATLKREEQAKSLVNHLGIADCFTAVVGSDDAEQRTKKDTIEIAMSLSGISSCEGVLMIGDSEFDAIGAAQAGVDFCAATYGFGLPPEALKKHPYKLQIASPLELLEKI